MNFDVNLLSNLMQMFASRPQQNNGGFQNYSASSDNMSSAQSGNRYTAQSAYTGTSGQNDAYRNDNQSRRSSVEQNGKVAYQSTSFAMENGIGDNVRFEQPKISRDTPPQTINPIFSILQMMQGISPQTAQNGITQAMQGAQNGDVMSSMLPLLMNLLKKPSSQPNSMNTKDNENNNTNSDCNYNSNINSTCNCNGNANNNATCNYNGDNNNTYNCTNDSYPNNNCDSGNDFNNDQQKAVKSTVNMDRNGTEDNRSIYKKTQPSFFKPIAFAGYELMSSLCKLYLTSALRHDR